ncbi:MAG: hypothetical protein ABSF47_01150 [Minisyncoccia bacterium]
MINITSADWTGYEKSIAIAVLQKIAYCQDKGKGLPVEVFEPFCRSKKNISTELVIFNEKGEIYLVKRPSLNENPSEPYPEQYHSPGATHDKNETLENTLERLRRREGVNFSSVEGVYPPRDSRDKERGRYLLCIFIADAIGAQTNAKGRFFKQEDIPWSELVSVHREIIVPAALEAFKKRNTKPQ